MANWLILCNSCGALLDEDEIDAILEAKFGPQVDEEDLDRAVLICADWDVEFHPPRGCEQFICDGEDCNQIVAVDPSSEWFVKIHKAEREEA